MKHYFLDRQGCRRSDADLLRGARGPANEARRRASTAMFPAVCARARGPSATTAISVSMPAASTVADDGVFSRDPVNLVRLFHVADRNDLTIHPDAFTLARRSLRLVDEALRQDPEANRMFLGLIDPLARPGSNPAADERGRRARPLHPGLRPHRGDDAVQHVSSLHGRRASAARRRQCRRDRGRGAARRTSAVERAVSHAVAGGPHGALCRDIPSRHRQGPPGKPFERRRADRRRALPAARSQRIGNRDRWHGWCVIIW